MSLNVGGGSSKGIINLVNDENAQGQEHVRNFGVLKIPIVVLKSSIPTEFEREVALMILK